MGIVAISFWVSIDYVKTFFYLTAAVFVHEELCLLLLRWTASMSIALFYMKQVWCSMYVDVVMQIFVVELPDWVYAVFDGIFIACKATVSVLFLKYKFSLLYM